MSDSQPSPPPPEAKPQKGESPEIESPEVESTDNPESESLELPDEAAQDAPVREPTAQELRELPGKVEAVLLTIDRPLPSAKLGQVLGGLSPKAIDRVIERLNADYEKTGRSFRIEAVAGGWQVMTLPQFADVLGALHRTRAQARLTPAALETLAIIAYQQPVLRAQIEAIRGVSCGEVLRSLMDRRLIKIVGRAQEIGRPVLYGTTKTFLELFGLASLKDLPKVQELRPASNPSQASS